MNLMIVGGAGFIGEQLTRYFVEAGHFVRVVDLPDRADKLSDLSSKAVQFCGVDFSILKEEDPVFSDIEVIIHLGTTSVPQTSMLDLEADARANILSAIRIMKGAVAFGVKRFFYASSGGAIYGDSEDLTIPESHITDPISSYAICKLTVEKYMNIFARTTSLRTISLRISNAYGPGQLIGTRIGLIAACIRKLSRGEEIEIFGDGSNIRDYVFVGDIVTSFAACLNEDNLPSGIYNIGYGQGFSVNQVLSLIEKISGQSMKIRYSRPRTFEVSRVVLDTTKFKKATGWKPKVDLPTGVSLMWRAATLQKLTPETTHLLLNT